MIEDFWQIAAVGFAPDAEGALRPFVSIGLIVMSHLSIRKVFWVMPNISPPHSLFLQSSWVSQRVVAHG